MIIWVCLSLASVTVVMAGLQLFVSLQRYRIKKPRNGTLSDADLPTVSVCIPARNETHALADCLQSVLTSDYDKLEMIVYDDCSQDKTSSIIRSFAHDGVRFIQGEVPAEGWLGKNTAYEVLAQNASGRYIVYLSVDTRITPSTIRQLVEYTLSKHISMVSVLPRRQDSGWRTSVFLAPLRYFIQMIVPQRVHTPAASSLWLVDREELRQIGGFAAVRNYIMPESALARMFDQTGTYRYIVGNDELGVVYAKKWRSQVDTSIRLSYPTLRKQPFFVGLVVLGMYAVGVVPYVVAISALITQKWDLSAVVASSFCVVYSLIFMVYARSVWRHGWLLGALAFPYLILQEIALILTSMVAYLSGKVDWKGRNICYPVLKRHHDS